MAAHSGIRRVRPIEQSAPPTARLKLTEAFGNVYRRGRWVHGPSLSLGVVPNRQAESRVGFRTRRGLKGAVVRNRLKRQLRAIVYAGKLPLKPGLDLVVVIHPRTPVNRTETLKKELLFLCRKAGAIL